MIPTVLFQIRKNKRRTGKYLFILLIPFIFIISCEKLDLQKVEKFKVTTAADANALLEDCFKLLKGTLEDKNDGKKKDFPVYLMIMSGLYSDNMDYSGSTNSWRDFDDHTLNSNNEILEEIWNQGFELIELANQLIISVPDITDLETSQKDFILGQAYGLRGYAHYLLMSHFVFIPFYDQPRYYSENPTQPTFQELIYLIEEDLSRAIDLIPDETLQHYLNKNAAYAILARLYLRNQDWSNAKTTAEVIINSGNHSLSENYNQLISLTSNTEIIWELDYATGENNKLDYYFNQNPSPLFVASSDLISSFEAGDPRKTAWINSETEDDIIIKYLTLDNNPDLILIRYAEILLIAAECAVHLNDLTSATAYLNQIRTRAGFANILLSTLPYSDALKEIMNERRKELAFEGLRWFDISRTESAVKIFGDLGENFDEHKTIWPIPQSALDQNPNLNQNPGY